MTSLKQHAENAALKHANRRFGEPDAQLSNSAFLISGNSCGPEGAEARIPLAQRLDKKDSGRIRS